MKNMTSEEVITGERLQELADVYLGFREDLAYNPRVHGQVHKHVYLEDLSEAYIIPSLLFCHTHRLGDFFQKLAYFQNPFVLLTHNSDDGIESFHPLLDSPKIIRWYAQNVAVFHPKMVSLPIGIANEQWTHGIDFLKFMAEPPIPTKTQDVYFHFSLHTNERERRACYDLLTARGIPFLPSLSPMENLHRLASYRYCVCPRGNGLDTHRFWEALYLDCVPIVLDSPWIRVLRYHYPSLPVVVLSRWDELDLVELQERTFDFSGVPKLSTLRQDILGLSSRVSSTLSVAACVVLVSVGMFQEYIVENLKQLLELGHEHRIYVITNTQFFSRLDEFAGRIHLVEAETLVAMDATEFDAHHRMDVDRGFRDEFWVHTSSRFFYLYYAMRSLHLTSVFHIENDVLLYHSVDVLLPGIDPAYMYIPFDSHERSIASVVYIPRHDILRGVLEEYDFSKNDMYNFSQIRARTGLLRGFPIFPSGIDPALDAVTPHYSDFGGMIMDAAAMGQYLGGVDPRNIHGDSTGFVNETCLVKYNQYQFYWDHHKPFLRISPTLSVPIFNLHIHSKCLYAFSTWAFTAQDG